MTPTMLCALSDAMDAVHHKGLTRTVAGWQSTRPRASVIEYHAFTTVNALIHRGYLQLWNNRKTAHITDAGVAALERWREATRETPQRELQEATKRRLRQALARIRRRQA